jgi:hypothetical protein
MAAPDPAPTDPKMTPPPTSSAKDLGGAGASSSSQKASKSIPPRPALGVNAAAVLSAIGAPAASVVPGQKSAGSTKKKGSNDGKASGGDTAAQTLEQTPEAKKKAQTMTFNSPEAASQEAAKDARSAPAVGSQVAGLPMTKLLTAREQEPTDSSPLTYREYAFAVPPGTPDQVGADVLRAQLRLVEAHIAHAKQGKLVNLAVFDVEFTGKPPKAPIATLTWKDWKGEPVVGFPPAWRACSRVRRRRSRAERRPPPRRSFRKRRRSRRSRSQSLRRSRSLRRRPRRRRQKRTSVTSRRIRR